MQHDLILISCKGGDLIMGITHGESKNTANDKTNAMEQERRIHTKVKKELADGAVYLDGESGRKVTVSAE